MIRWIQILSVGLLLWILTQTAYANQFDQSHAAWDKLLRDHVVMINQGRASQADYAGFTKPFGVAVLFKAAVGREQKNICGLGQSGTAGIFD